MWKCRVLSTLEHTPSLVFRSTRLNPGLTVRGGWFLPLGGRWCADLPAAAGKNQGGGHNQGDPDDQQFQDRGTGRWGRRRQVLGSVGRKDPGERLRRDSGGRNGGGQGESESLHCGEDLHLSMWSRDCRGG